ncbi:calpain-1 catalytic subunit-like [Biomphalaria glabrata]|uniref:Calpain-1 catalytic subunit-like n=1 Tax=Biomphalaria glabrata TaxID=6526 RepID=A0A9W3BJY8_BIOGL|nr:calpain-1 catalytic subunit-like [Biomphalaria glabrata]XP_055899744.1 calpain-1 catalytic subunit-like [Biomphalaria glabrata]XP_055899753.1 calpain-1 catalytic subunit-like [Biomphalaria glabrata]
MGCGASKSSDEASREKYTPRDDHKNQRRHHDDSYNNRNEHYNNTHTFDERQDFNKEHNLSRNTGHSYDEQMGYYPDHDYSKTDEIDAISKEKEKKHGYDLYGSQAEDNKKLRPRSPIYEEDDTPFDDDGYRDNVGYYKNSVGLMEKTLDFRRHFLDEEPDQRPYGNPDHLYVDDEFPLEMAIVQDNNEIDWKRPKEFVDHPKLFTDGSTRFDIGQGSAGTCWFLSIVADIADNKQMLKQVLPNTAYFIEDPDKYDGIFHARFFRFGKWEDVYIDDFLPVIYGNTLWGAKSSTDDNEMWVALLEKAFARLHGSYDAIYGGQPGDAYLQLTGGIGERIELEGLQDKTNAIFNRIKNALSSNCQITCVVPDEYDNYKGLVGGHAYSLVDAKQINQTKLIRVRNPWGHGEWKGAWCDGSPEWKSIPANSLQFPNKDDGEFYVCLEDFMKYFSHTTICSLTPDFDMDGCSDSLNHILNIYGEWYRNTAAGFHKLLQNPRFSIVLSSQGALEDGKVPVVLQMIQHSKKRKTDNVSIRCDIFKVLGDKIRQSGRCIALEIQGQKNNVYSPELQSSFRFRLTPGRYLIIPSTVDERQEKAFLLRLFSPGPLESVKEIPRDVNLTSCENEESIDIKGKKYPLTFEKTLFGEFFQGVNAGGQISNQESYSSNPQYLVIVPDIGSDIPLVVHIMQKNVEPQYPVGVRLYKIIDGHQLPLDTKYLYENYSKCPRHLEGDQSKFVISWDVDVRYLLAAGKYILLIHLDEPNTEKPFSILFKSTQHITIKGFQTG